MKGKIKPNGITSQKTGPTFTENDPAKFHGAGKSSGKTPANGVECGPSGSVTFTVDKAAIGSFPNADKAPPMTKVESEKTGTYSPTETAGDKTASQSGPGGPTNVPYALKERYSKGARK